MAALLKQAFTLEKRGSVWRQKLEGLIWESKENLTQLIHHVRLMNAKVSSRLELTERSYIATVHFNQVLANDCQQDAFGTAQCLSLKM